MSQEIGQAGATAQHPSGLDYALQWAQLPSDHLQIALKALEPELKRTHEFRMQQDAHRQELELERLRLESAQKQLQDQLTFDETQAKRSHTLYMVGLIAGFVISAGMLTAAVIVGINNQPWLAAMLAGPSVISIASLFVLRKNDKTLNAATEQSHRRALNASQQPPQPPPAGGPVI
ncbi:hypothetical protein ADK53_28655 [Streptomyces sp. WM6373]|uniref:hypothetical protein n=1 Tax=Streptomyces sp. WM6373 TaxID=1415556 RepID=UPI0006AF18A7|nr:hypothetical protein [Streptomyces sp. WM6373]KOU30192.1 hypothetical protein ADK53_28655 [Streptomyces sp. WM6373]